MKTILISRGQRWLEIEDAADGLRASRLSGTFVHGYVVDHKRRSDGTRFFGLMSHDGDMMPVVLMVGNGRTSRNLVCGMFNGNPYPNYGEDIAALSATIGVQLPPSDYPYGSGREVPHLPTTKMPIVTDTDLEGENWVELRDGIDDEVTSILHREKVDAVMPFADRARERAAGVRYIALISSHEGPPTAMVVVRLPTESARMSGELPTVVGADGYDPYQTYCGCERPEAIQALGEHLNVDLSSESVHMPSKARPNGRLDVDEDEPPGPSFH